jgi:hypothetical protein
MPDLYHLAPEGPLLGSERDATDLVGEAYGAGAAWIAIPLSRLAPDFFDLKNGIAGAFIQKLVNYGFRVAFIGDIAPATARSEALAAFVRESNRGRHVRFAPDASALEP